MRGRAVRRTGGLLVALAIGTAFATTVPAGAVDASVDFPAYMHDTGHSAYSPDATATTPTTPLTRAWLFRATRTAGQPTRSFVATPIVVDHVVYAGANTGDFYAIDESTGQVLWKDALGYEGAYTCGAARGFAATAAAGIDPATKRLTIYAPAGDGNLDALDAADGTVVWSAPVNVPSPGVNDYFNYSSPEISHGRIYIGISSMCDNPLVRAGVVAIDQATGTRLRTFYTVPRRQIGGSVCSSPAVAPDGTVVITTGNAQNGVLIGTAQSIVRLTKSLRFLDSWQLTGTGIDSDFGGSPTIFSATLDGVVTPMVGACNKNGFYYAWRLDDLHDGPVWSDRVGVHNVQTQGEICIAGAVWDGQALYLAGPPTTVGGTFFRGSVRKLDPATGAEDWVTGLPAAVMTSASLDGAGALAASSFDLDDSVTNTTFLVDTATGSFVTIDSDASRSASSPVFADGDLLVATGRGRIYDYVPTGPAPAGRRSAGVRHPG